MRNILFFICVIIYPFETFCQIDFELEQVYFDGIQIVYSDFREGYGVVVLPSNEIYAYDSSIGFTNISDLFSTIDHTKITCVKVLKDNIILVGTTDNYLLKIENNIATKLDSEKGLGSSQVNSIIFYENRLYVGTSNGVYYSKDITNFTRQNTDYKKRQYYEQDGKSIFTTNSGYSSCGETNDKWFSLTTGPSTYYFGIYAPRGDNSKGLISDAISLKTSLGVSRSTDIVSIANKYGLWSYKTSCSTPYEWKTLLDIAVNDLFYPQNFPTYSLPEILIISADDGLHYLLSPHNWAYYTSSVVNRIEELDGIKCLNTSYGLCDNSLWVGTEVGLYKIKINNEVIYNKDEIESLRKEYMFCQDDSLEIEGINYPNFDHVWYKNEDLVQDSSRSMLIVTEPGIYKQAYSNCVLSDEIVFTVQLDDRDNSILSYTGPEELCFDHNKYLRDGQSNKSYLTYQWYKNEEAIVNETNPYHRPHKSGNYFFSTTNCNGFVKYSDTVSLVVNDSIPVPKISEFYNKELFCYGDTLGLTNFDGLRINWIGKNKDYGNENIPYYVLNSNDRPTTVVYTDLFGCQNKLSLGHQQYLYYPPNSSFDEDTLAICDGANKIITLNQEPFTIIEWGDDYDNANRMFNEEGIYTIKSYNSFAECGIQYDTLVVYILDKPDFKLPNDTAIFIFDQIELFGPSNNLEFYWGYDELDNAEKKIVSASKDTIVTQRISVQNGNGCWARDEMKIKFTKNLNVLNLYPNPSKNGVFLNNPDFTILRSEVFKPSGSMVYSQSFSGYSHTEYLSTQNLESGLYIIVVLLENGKYGRQKYYKIRPN